MVRRRTKRRRQRVQAALAKSEEPPGLAAMAAHPIITAVTAATVGAGAGFGVAKLMKGKKQDTTLDMPESPIAGNSTELKPGQKTNAIATSPQGILTPPNSARTTLLGGVA